MSKTIITARIRADGKVVKVSKDGKETPFANRPMRPMTAEELRKAKRLPRVKNLRRALGFTQEEFAVRYQIPIGALRDWEQGRSEPDQPTRAYLKIIARDPECVHRMLNAPPRMQGPMAWVPDLS